MNGIDTKLVLAISFYMLILAIIYITNIKSKFTKQKQIIFYFILSTIIPIFIFLLTIIT